MSGAGDTRAPVAATAADGWTLRGELLAPPHDPCAVAITGHAMMVDRRTMDHPTGRGLASALCLGGLAVLNFDVRGHGDSGPGALAGGSWTYDDIVRLDLPAMVAAARERFPGRPVAVVGHSLVGHAALVHAGLDPGGAADAVVAIAANLWAPRLEPALWARAAKGGVLLAWAALTRLMGAFDSRRLGWGSDAEAWPYVRQFLEIYLRDRLQSPGGEVDYAAALGRAAVPVFALSSEGDRLLARPAAVERFLGLLEAARVEHHVVQRRLRRWAPDHMQLVLSPSCRIYWDQIARWLVQTLCLRGPAAHG